MVKKYNFEPYTTKFSVCVEEGDVSYNPDAIGEFGTQPFWDFTDRVHKGDFVELIGEKNGIPMVKKADSHSEELFGVCIVEPKWKDEVRPRENTASADAPKRQVTVRVFADLIHEFDLVDDNAELEVGDSIVFVGDNKFDKATTPNNTRVLLSREALVGGSVPIVMNSWGVKV